MTLLDYLRSERLTFQEFGTRIGRDRTQVWRYAMGKRVPDLETALAIEVATGGAVSPRSFVRPGGDAEAAA